MDTCFGGEERKRLGDCGVKNQKYEQFHYNFYSEDSVHHLKVVNRTKLNDIRINVNKNKESWFYFNRIKNKNDDQQKIVINGKEYKCPLIDTFRYDNNELYKVYSLSYGLLLYKVNRISYSLLKYK